MKNQGVTGCINARKGFCSLWSILLFLPLLPLQDGIAFSPLSTNGKRFGNIISKNIRKNESKRGIELFIANRRKSLLLITATTATTDASVSTEQLSTVASDAQEATVTGTLDHVQHDQVRYGAVRRSVLEKGYFDLVVVGGGPAGIAGAVMAAQLGRRVIIVDKPTKIASSDGLDVFFGGPTGLYSKALRDAAKNINVDAMRAQGLDDDVIWKQFTNTILNLASRNAEGQIRMLQQFKIHYLQGEASIVQESDQRSISAINQRKSSLNDDEEGTPKLRSIMVRNACIYEDDDKRKISREEEIVLCTEKVLVCTGSKAMEPLSIPFDGKKIFNGDSISNLSFLPKSVIINGAGIIAIEFANIFNRMGSDVTLLVRGNLHNSILKLGIDRDVASELVNLLQKSGVIIKNGISVSEFLSNDNKANEDDKENEKVTIKLSDGTKSESDIFLVAFGRAGNGGSLTEPHANAAQEDEENIVKANECGNIILEDEGTLSTHCNGVSAAGDVIGAPALASTSMAQAQLAVRHMFQSDSENKKLFMEQYNAKTFVENLSVGIWTIPEVGYYGLTKEQALERYPSMTVVEGTAKYSRCLRGRVFAPNGFLKLVVESTSTNNGDGDNNKNFGRILGVHIIGQDAAELVHYGMSLVKTNSTIFDIMCGQTFTAVTFHELFREAAVDANMNLDFGLEWQQIFQDLSFQCSLAVEECEIHNDCDGDDFITEKTDLEKVKCIFESIDTDGNGKLDADELHQLFFRLGRKVYKRTISNLLRVADEDGDCTLDWDEFKAIWERLPAC